MKNKLFITLMLLAASVCTKAAVPTLKIGYVNLDYVMRTLPDAKKVETDLKAFELQLRNRLELKANNFQEKLQSFQKAATTMTDAAKAKKEQELQQLHGEIEQLQLDSQNSMATKQMELLEPIYQKVQQTIEALAKENEYTYVLNSNSVGISIILYAQEQYDLSDLVLKRLGVNPKELQKDEKNPSSKVGNKTTEKK